MKKLLLLVAELLVGSASLLAQDVTVSESQWFEHTPPPDTLAAVKSRFRPVYPERLESSLSGYVILRLSLDARGKRTGFSARTTYPEFEGSIVRVLEDLEMRPAQKGGEPVASNAWLAIIFNAANTAPKKPDALPRTLAIAPVVLSRELKKNPGTVWTNVSLDATGAPQSFTLEDPANEEFRPEIAAALPRWKFAPARKGGVAVAAETRAAFFVIAPSAPRPTGNGTPPKPISRERPIYPPGMRRSGLQGEVTVGFTVDAQGGVINAAVVRSNNPGFDDAALECVRKWKFQPGTRDGKPVETSMQLPIIFSLTIDGTPGREAAQVKPASKEAQEKLPPQYRYDIEPHVRAIVLPVYPYPLLREKVKGRARIAALVDARGRVTQIKVLEATHPEFGHALAAAFGEYVFDPAIRDGQPTATLISKDHAFGPDEDNDLTTDADLRLLSREKKKPDTIVGPDQLDAPLKPTVRRSPPFPAALNGRVVAGEAVIELLIDEDGHARLPRIVSATEPAFGYSAVQAVALWQFEPPKAGGKPAVVRARIPVNFSAPKPPATPPPGGPKPADPAPPSEKN